MTTPSRDRLRILTEELRITETPGQLPTITATLARGNMINRNQRYYSATVLERAATEAHDRIQNGELIGLMDHPGWDDGVKGKPERTVIRWGRLWMDGPNLEGEGVIIQTALGKDLLAMHQGKVRIPLSTNAFATTHFENAEDVPAAWDGDPHDLIEVIDTLELLTVDVVNDASNTYAAVHAEASARRETHLREAKARDPDKEQGMTEQEKQQHAAQLAALEAERDEAKRAQQTAEQTLARERRESIAREAIAAKGVTSEALKAAITLTAVNAESDDAAKTAVLELAAAVPASNGNNHIPDNTKPVVDVLAEARAEVGVNA